jgi:AcrR family transcriptional regulator
MTFYWIYNLSNWELCALIVGVFLGLSLAGLFISRPLVRVFVKASPRHNDIVSYFFAGIGVFYGLALGLIAVATWDDYTQIDGVVTTEAAAVASLYRDLDGYPQPLRERLERIMREYTHLVIEQEWPAHKKGLALEDGDAILDHLENEVMSFEPRSEREKIVQAEVVRSLDTVMEQRRLRLQAVTTGLPAALWSVVLVGALLNVVLSYLFWVENVGLHAALVAIMAAFIGLLVFLTAAMDNPFRGEFSVTCDAFQSVLENVMRQGSS